jgi:hypothetical protein
MNLQQLKEKYKLNKGAKYEPDPKCRHCHGAGERQSNAIGGMTFCACLYFEPEFREEALGLIAQSVRTAFAPNAQHHQPGATKESHEQP